MERRSRYLLWALILIYAVGASAYSIVRHVNRQSATLDLAIQAQVIWNTAQGRPFESSIEVSNYLADHLSLILAGLAPLYWIWPDVRLLLAFQAFALALGAYPVYRLARAECGKERIALLFALLYLLYPALGFLVRFDFHAEALVVPLLLAALWTWKEGRFGWAMLSLVLALFCREETGLVIAGLGLVLALGASGQERRLAWQWTVIGLTWSFLGIGFVMPHLRGQPSDTFLACFSHLGPSYSQALGRLVTNPLGALRDSWQGLVPFKATFLPRLLLPLVFLPLLAPAALLPILPAVLPGILSRCLPHSTIYYQYTAPIVPFVFWAGMRGFTRLEQFFSRRLGQAGLASIFRAALPIVMILGTVVALAWDLPWCKQVEGSGLYSVGLPRRLANQEAFEEAAALVPVDASLATDNALGPQFAHRRGLYLFAYWESWRADYVLVDLQAAPPTEDIYYLQLERLLELPGEDGSDNPGWTPSPFPVSPEDPGGTPMGSFGVRYWRQGILLLVRGFPADPVLHQEVLLEVLRLHRQFEEKP